MNIVLTDGVWIKSRSALKESAISVVKREIANLFMPPIAISGGVIDEYCNAKITCKNGNTVF